VEALLEVHKQYNDLVQTAFNGEAGFVASLDKACGEFVNRNKVCRASTSKSPELLARFCDSLLKKSAKNPEENELEDVLNSVVRQCHRSDKRIITHLISPLPLKDDCIQVCRRQGRIPKVLLQDAG
jgi:hypothetical protein